jgi:hypothetical protein
VGREIVRTIAAAKFEEVDTGFGPDPRIIVELEADPDDAGTPGQLSCTKRLAKEIAGALGGVHDYEQWTGRTVVLYAKTVAGYGKQHDVVGARAVRGGEAA